MKTSNKSMLRKIFINGITCLGSFMIFFLILEIVIRIFAPQPVNIKGTRFSNTLIYENIPRAEFTIKSAEFETEVVYNNEGFRDNDFELEKKGLRIAVLGDSYVDAVQVPFKDMFPNQLETLLNQRHSSDIEVMNFGVGGYGTDQELIVLKNNVLKYKPDIVLLLYVHNDIHDILKNNLISTKNGKLTYRIHKPNVVWKNFKALIRNLHTYYFLTKKCRQLPVLARTIDKIKVSTFKLFGEKFMNKHFPQIASDVRENKDSVSIPVDIETFLNPLPARVKKLWDLEYKILQEIQNVSQKHKAKFAMVIVARTYQLHESILHETLAKYNIKKSEFIVNNANKILVEFAEKRNIPILDLYSIFKKQIDAGKVLHFRKDGHWNSDGHALAAWGINNFLIKNDLFDD